MAEVKKSSKIQKAFNLSMTGFWALLAVPTVLWWKESVLWVAIMSLYANVVGHWSAYQATRAEVEAENGNGT